jgi:tRNA threonylcarbamoyl adenosine modification protein YjeE
MCPAFSGRKNLRLPLERETASEEETEALGRELSSLLRPGDALLIEGPLGAGKTVLCRGTAVGLGVDPRQVRSPSFNILLQYRGRILVHHVDLYRITGSREAAEAGVEDALWDREAVSLVEWAERLQGIPLPPGFDVQIEPTGGDRRRVTVRRRD